MTALDRILMDYLDDSDPPTQPRLQIARVLAEEMSKEDLSNARRISQIVQRISSTSIRAVRPKESA